MPVAEGMPRVYHDKEEWAAALKRLRVKTGYTQKEASSLCGVPLTTWIAWENQRGVPSRLAQIALRNIFPDLE